MNDTLQNLRPQIVIPIDADKALSKYAKNDEVVQLIKSILEAVSQLKSSWLERIESKGTEWDKGYRTALEKLSRATAEAKGIIGTVNMTRGELVSHIASVERNIEKIKETIPKPLDIAYIEDAVHALQQAMANMPHHPSMEDIRKEMGVEKLDERFDEIRTMARHRVQTPAKSYQIHTVDLSSQVDGVETTFNVGGSHFGIMGVYSTQAPLIFRPIIDYVETRNGFTLQGITIQSGQTLTAQ